MKDLTKEQKRILLLMYKEVLCRQEVLDFDTANYFVNSNEIRDMFLPDASSEHVSKLCWKLKAKGYITCQPGDDLANHIEIEDKAIIHFENAFSNNLISITEFLLKRK